MCFRFLQVAFNFIRSGELPHHDHGHVEGVEEIKVPAEPPRFSVTESLKGEPNKEDGI
jgi:C4-dicarboxylate transporter DctQ subunit